MLLLFCFNDKEICNVSKHNIKAPSCNHCCSGKATSTTEPVCVLLDLDIQHAIRMHHYFSVACPALQYFHIIS